MFKLTNILQEIQVISNITPQMVFSSWLKLSDKYEDNRFYKTKIYKDWDQSHTGIIPFLNSCNKTKLEIYYRELLDLQNKNK